MPIQEGLSYPYTRGIGGGYPVIPIQEGLEGGCPAMPIQED
jgi:hypothetical protein